jgi:hypothetical protein
MKKKIKIQKSTLGDLLCYLQKDTYNLRAIEGIGRLEDDTGWLYVYGTTVMSVDDTWVLSHIPKRTESDWAPYGR